MLVATTLVLEALLLAVRQARQGSSLFLVAEEGLTAVQLLPLLVQHLFGVGAVVEVGLMQRAQALMAAAGLLLVAAVAAGQQTLVPPVLAAYPHGAGLALTVLITAWLPPQVQHRAVDQVVQKAVHRVLAARDVLCLFIGDL
jgi:hypothetical protein